MEKKCFEGQRLLRAAKKVDIMQPNADLNALCRFNQWAFDNADDLLYLARQALAAQAVIDEAYGLLKKLEFVGWPGDRCEICFGYGAIAGQRECSGIHTKNCPLKKWLEAYDKASK